MFLGEAVSHHPGEVAWDSLHYIPPIVLERLTKHQRNGGFHVTTGTWLTQRTLIFSQWDG